MKKVLIYLIGFLLLAFLLGVIFLYTPDKPLEELKAEWAYDDSKFMDVQGLPVHYRINGTGEPLVLIPGTGASLHTWEEWTKILENDFKVISLDMPAFGLTGPNQTGKYSLEYYAEFLDEFLSKLGVSSCHIGGNSLGGSISWRYATMYPDKVKKLILLDAGGYRSEEKQEEKEPPLAFRLANSPILSKILLKITPRSLFESSMKEVYHNDDLVTEELVNRYYQLFLRPGNRQAFIDRIKNTSYTDPSLIATIKAPTLIQWGKTDEWIPVANAYKFQKDIEGSEVVIYENAGHLPMEEIPEESAKDAREFLLKQVELVSAN